MAHMIAKYPASRCPICSCTTPLADHGGCNALCRGTTDLPAAGGWARPQADLRAHVPLGGCVQRVHVVHLGGQPRRLACGLAATAAPSSKIVLVTGMLVMEAESCGHLQGVAFQVWREA